MTILALVSGQIFKAPESRTSKNGKAFVSGTLRFKDDESSQFVRFVAFSESVQAELMRLVDGDSLSVQGAMKAVMYQPEGGEPRVSLSIIADQVLSLRSPPKAGKAPPRPNDDIPFGDP